MGFTGWLIFAVVLFILFQVLKAWSKQHTLKELRDGSNPDGAYVWPELGEFEVDVVGESRHQRELQEIALHSAPGGPSRRFLSLRMTTLPTRMLCW